MITDNKKQRRKTDADQDLLDTMRNDHSDESPTILQADGHERKRMVLDNIFIPIKKVLKLVPQAKVVDNNRMNNWSRIVNFVATGDCELHHVKKEDQTANEEGQGVQGGRGPGR